MLYKICVLVSPLNLIFSGNGYIPVSSLKEILHELDPKLTSDEIDGIIEEIDEDGSGTVDFDGMQCIVFNFTYWLCKK